ncbi:unnamed protein product [Durusdinium trenchii]|uniref:Uncharacterized protein n=1 Tax=Durusdinium trenchii TaxID=1381693 RepID=A0ABP0M3K5_9DINO
MSDVLALTEMPELEADTLELRQMRTEELVLVTESSRVNDECIALQLHLSDEPKDLKVTAANGEQYQLVLLRGPAAKDIDGMPEDQDEDPVSDLEQKGEARNDEMADKEQDMDRALQDDVVEDEDQEQGCEVLLSSDEELPNLGLEAIEQDPAD